MYTIQALIESTMKSNNCISAHWNATYWNKLCVFGQVSTSLFTQCLKLDIAAPCSLLSLVVQFPLWSSNLPQNFVVSIHSADIKFFLSLRRESSANIISWRPSGPGDFQFGIFPNCPSMNSAVNSMSACLSISSKSRCSSDGHSALPLSVFFTSSPDAIPEFSSFFSSRSDDIISSPISHWGTRLPEQ